MLGISVIVAQSHLRTHDTQSLTLPRSGGALIVTGNRIRLNRATQDPDMQRS